MLIDIWNFDIYFDVSAIWLNKKWWVNHSKFALKKRSTHAKFQGVWEWVYSTLEKWVSYISGILHAKFIVGFLT